jgi:hypothetical protein
MHRDTLHHDADDPHMLARDSDGWRVLWRHWQLFASIILKLQQESPPDAVLEQAIEACMRNAHGFVRRRIHVHSHGTFDVLRTSHRLRGVPQREVVEDGSQQREVSAVVADFRLRSWRKGHVLDPNPVPIASESHRGLANLGHCLLAKR